MQRIIVACVATSLVAGYNSSSFAQEQALVQTQRPAVLKSVVNGNKSLCGFFSEYLRDAEWIGTSLFWPQNKKFSEVTIPEWHDLEPQDHKDILKRFYMDFDLGQGRKISDLEWQTLHWPRMLESIGRWKRKLQRSVFDMDNDGEVENIYRLSFEVHETLPPRHSFQLLPNGTLAWHYDVSVDERPKLSSAWRGLSGASDFFIYGNQTIFVTWGNSADEVTVDIAVPQLIAHQVTGNVFYRPKSECVFTSASLDKG